MRRQINGILLLDKPPGKTSNQALQYAKRLLQAIKAGHTGSLDPIATGMLPICFGEATKFSQFLLDSDKSYHVVAKLGEQTTTGDIEGDIIAVKSSEHISSNCLQSVMQKFIGEISQIPPMYSAIKKDGQPLYKLARQGIVVERQSRIVQLFNVALERFEHPEFSFTVHCSKGTYVRTLVEDLAQHLDCVAHVTALRRTEVTPYQGFHMYTFEELEEIKETAGIEGLINCLLPVETAVQGFPAVQLSTSAAFYLKMGQAVRVNLPQNTTLVKLMSEDATFLGMGEVMEDGRVKPHRLVAAA